MIAIPQMMKKLFSRWRDTPYATGIACKKVW